MQRRRLGRTGLTVSSLGFGAFKIGRNQGTNYPERYELPNEATVERLLNEVLDGGISYIDTAPAYGVSEERIGRAIAHRRGEFVLSTKVGETFENGTSTYDFSEAAVRSSVERSLRRLQTEVLDVVFIHSNGDDLSVINDTDAVATLCNLKAEGTIRAVGMSGKTLPGAWQALDWVDVIMVEYHLNDRSHEPLIAEAGKQGVGVVVKKGLASGHLEAAGSISFVLANEHVSSLAVGGLNLDHIRTNIAAAKSIGKGVPG